MKIYLKFGTTKKIVEIDSNTIINSVKQKAYELFVDIPSKCELVIKLGNTILADDDRIETIGLVSGDVLYVEQCGNQVQITQPAIVDNRQHEPMLETGPESMSDTTESIADQKSIDEQIIIDELQKHNVTSYCEQMIIILVFILRNRQDDDSIETDLPDDWRNQLATIRFLRITCRHAKSPRHIVDVELMSYVDDQSIRIQLSSIYNRHRQFGNSHIFRAIDCCRREVRNDEHKQLIDINYVQSHLIASVIRDIRFLLFRYGSALIDIFDNDYLAISIGKYLNVRSLLSIESAHSALWHSLHRKSIDRSLWHRILTQRFGAIIISDAAVISADTKCITYRQEYEKLCIDAAHQSSSFVMVREPNRRYQYDDDRWRPHYDFFPPPPRVFPFVRPFSGPRGPTYFDRYPIFTSHHT